jgi:hypothetical protein
MRPLQYDPITNRVCDDENTPCAEVDPDLWMSRGDRDEFGQLIVSASGMESLLRHLVDTEGNITIAQGIAHFPDGSSKDIRALLPRPLWLFQHQEAALSQGWGVFQNADTKTLEIQRYDVASNPFPNDESARDHVSELANAGNVLAAHAMDVLNAFRRVEPQPNRVDPEIRQTSSMPDEITKDWQLTIGEHGASIHSDQSGTIAKIPDIDVNWRAHAKLIHSAPETKAKAIIMHEALCKAHKALNAAACYFDDQDSPSVVLAVETALEDISSALHASMESP